MNNTQRKSLTEAFEAVHAALNAFVEVCEREEQAERDKFDSLPEGLQDSERGEAIERAADALNEAADTARCAIDDLNEHISEAAE